MYKKIFEYLKVYKCLKTFQMFEKFLRILEKFFEHSKCYSNFFCDNNEPPNKMSNLTQLQPSCF